MNYDKVSLPETFNSADIFLIAPKFEFTFTKDLYWSSLIQYSNQTENYCGNPENNWIYRIVVDDYDDNGLLDIYNYQMDNRPLHRWEWNGSKYIKVE